MSSIEDQTRVFLWTAPRCISTAFERAIINLYNGKIFHEPFSQFYYFGPNRKSDRYRNIPDQLDGTLDAIGKSLSAKHEGKKFVFSKDMAYYLKDNFEILRQKGLRNFKHSFLIRNPKKAVPSLYHASINSKKTSWDYFDPQEAGFRELLDLYELVVKELDQSPIVVDADDLLENPEAMMKKYCDASGLEYMENMTSWEPGVAIPEWNVWTGWHDAVAKSSGIKKKDKMTSSKEKESDEIDEILSCVNESLKCYEVLYEKRLRLDS